MEVKLFEVRDVATFIPCVAIRWNPRNEAERYLLARAGFGLDAETQRTYVMMAPIDGGHGGFTCDPYGHGQARTLTVAHEYIIEEWDRLESGNVIDVEYVLGVTAVPKPTERITAKEI